MRKISLNLLLLVALFTGIGYLLPNEVKVEKIIRIQAPITEVYRQVNNLKNWDKWSGMVPLDSAMNLEFIATKQGDTGFCWKTTGMNPQKRRLLVTGTSWCDSLSAKMSFNKDDIASSCFHFSENDGTTVVSWVFRTKLNNDLISRWSGPFIHNLIAPDLNHGLTKLKTISEEQNNDSSPQYSEL